MTEIRRRAVPGATLGGRMARTSKPCACSSPRHEQRAIVVAEHDRDDLRGAGRHRHAGGAQRARADTATRPASRARRSGSLRDDLEAGVERGGQRRRRRRREDERPGALDQIVDRPRGPGDERAADAERLARRVDRHADVAVRSRTPRSGRCRARRNSPTACASSTMSAAPVDRHSAAYSASGGTSPSMLNSDSVTTNAWPPAGRSRSARASASTSLCGNTTRPARRQPDAVDQAGVIALVREDDVAALRQRRQDGQVGQIAAREIQRALGPLERGEVPLDGGEASRSPRSSREPVLPHAVALDGGGHRAASGADGWRGRGSRSTRSRCRPAARACAGADASRMARRRAADARFERLRGIGQRGVSCSCRPRSANSRRSTSAAGLGVVSS